MTLDDLMQMEDIPGYYILRYGFDYVESDLGEEGLRKTTVEMAKGASKNVIYLIMAGISGQKCVYRYAIRLTEKLSDKIYRWERVPLKIDEYSNRLVFSTEYRQQFYNSSAMGPNYIVDEIYGKQLNRTVDQFNDYDSVELSFIELREIVENKYSDYYKAFSSIKAIYMIIDGNTGKMYVGSAYGQDGLWGRWASYVESYHGGNTELKKLFENNGEEYFLQFKYLVLHILPMRASDADVLVLESKYKKRFLTKEFGLNDN